MKSTLSYRHELKYLINYHQYAIIRQRLKASLTADKHANLSGEYHIRSLYFDDIDNKALHEKLGGVRDRVKYRIRIYNLTDNVIHLEKKIKFNDYVSKVKTRLSRELADQVIAGNYEALNNPLEPLHYEVYLEMKQKLLRPKVIVDYVREAYTSIYGNVRITFDKQLKSGLNSLDLFNPELATVSAFDHPLIVLEVKYDEYLPAVVQMALQQDGLHRQSNSKYVICTKYTKSNSWEDQ